MGLYVDVGQLARCIAAKDREAVRDVKRRLKKLNEALKVAGVEEHHEPEDLKGKQPWGCKIAGWPALTPLKRLAAHVWLRVIRDEVEHFEAWPAPWEDGGVNGAGDPQLAYYFSSGGEWLDHLMYHEETGYYVPIDFYEPIYPFDDKLTKHVGEVIGASERLLSDCEDVAKVIGLPTDLDPTSKCFHDAINSAAKLGGGWWNYPLESYACLQLITAARKSLELGSVIVFG
jgi:hypothetical protein